MSRVAVVGVGYVGLPTAACLAALGHTVVGCDVDQIKVDKLNAGVSTMHEVGLDDLLHGARADGRLAFICSAPLAVMGAEFTFLCLPTPPCSDGSVDLSHILAVVDEIGPHLMAGSVLITKSTVPIGTSRLLAKRLNRSDVIVVSNPEFLREGAAVEDFLRAERVVVGADSAEASQSVGRLYAGTDAPVISVSPESAEIAKYAANAFLATKLSFVNEISAMCEELGADAGEVFAAVGADSRIGAGFLEPGPGWGGSCLPKDSAALLHAARSVELEPTLLRETIQANEQQFVRIADKVCRAVGGSLPGRILTIWGLTFKAGSDDLRMSPSLKIADLLIAAGASIRAFDPTLDGQAASLGADITLCPDAYSACEGSSAILVLTEWPQFGDLDLHRAATQMVWRAVVDARRVIDPAKAAAAGFTLDRIGSGAAEERGAGVKVAAA
ncbi:MAG: nucleotide sugar dehydrogenase [Acidimicrobiaceae bacterium]|nr:nucleotide sugar dehydrogenase [Acidimicrobiaceae bacterium]